MTIALQQQKKNDKYNYKFSVRTTEWKVVIRVVFSAVLGFGRGPPRSELCDMPSGVVAGVGGSRTRPIAISRMLREQRPTDQPTDKAAYGVACTRLKSVK